MLDSLLSQHLTSSGCQSSGRMMPMLTLRSAWVATLALSLLGLSACESMPVSSPSGTSTIPVVVNTPSEDSADSVPSSSQGSIQGATSSPQPQSPKPVVIITTTVPANPPVPAKSNVPAVREAPTVPQNHPLTQQPRYEEGTHSAERPFAIPEIINPPKLPTYEPPSLPPVPVIDTPSQPAQSAREALLERARHNSQAGFETKPAPSSNGDNLPAFRNLMDKGIADLKANRLSAAESKFTRAQRLAPRSSAVYFYLSQVALKKGQPKKAEAMARRGLVVAEDANRRRALWQLVLRSGQMQNNARVISEASKALR